MTACEGIIYLDHNASTPVHPSVLEVMLPYWESAAGNPSSLHRSGVQARQGVEEARASLASALLCDPEEIHFTSGGTEADNWAIKVLSAADAGKIITSAVEHHAVLHSCQHLQGSGREVVYLPVDTHGQLDLQALEDIIEGGDVSLLSIMHANNETGSLQPVVEAGEMARERGILFHVDAVQTFGKVPVHPAALNADAVSMSAHKINGPKGVGALYLRSGTSIEPLMHGGDHEGGVRAGTENVAGIVGFGRASQLCQQQLDHAPEQWRQLRDHLEAGLSASVDDIVINGRSGPRMMNTSSIAFTGVESEAIVMGLDLAGIAVSSGSACASGKTDPSHVLLAMGLEPRLAASSVRFSIGLSNDQGEIDRVVEAVPEIVTRLRALSVF